MKNIAATSYYRGVLKWLQELSGSLGYHGLIGQAIFSAYVSLFAGVVETIISLVTGEEEGSSSLIGVTIMAVAEITGSVLVLYRWKFMDSAQESAAFSQQPLPRTVEHRREVLFSGAIALMMTILGVFLFYSSMQALAHAKDVESVADGVFVAGLDAVLSFFLYAWKYNVGEQLQSIVVIMDAKCSRCLGLISLLVIVALILEKLVWWADSFVGVALAIYIVGEGISSLRVVHMEWEVKPTEDEGLRLVPFLSEKLLSPEDTYRDGPSHAPHGEALLP